MKKSISFYIYYLCFLISFLIVIRILYSRYNFIVIRPDKYYVPSVYFILLWLIFAIIIFYTTYMNRHYPDRDTIIRKTIRNHPVIKDSILGSYELYKKIYIYRIMDIDEYLERFKIYRNIQRICANLHNSSLKFRIALEERKFNKLRFEGLLGAVFEWFTIFLCIYEPINICYYNVLSYREIAVLFILLTIRRIIRYWNHKICLKENVIYEEMKSTNNEIELIYKEVEEIRKELIIISQQKDVLLEYNNLELELDKLRAKFDMYKFKYNNLPIEYKKVRELEK